jgi:hypothetical protein
MIFTQFLYFPRNSQFTNTKLLFSLSPIGGGGSTAVGDVTFSSYNSINANNTAANNNSTYATAADGSTLLSRIDESAASSSAAAAAAAMAGGQMNLCSTAVSAGGGGGGGLSTSSHQVGTRSPLKRYTALF